MKHKSKTSNSSTSKREDTKLNNPSYIRETTGEDFISDSNLSSATAKKRQEVDEITSSTGSSIAKRDNVHMIHDDNNNKDRLARF